MKSVGTAWPWWSSWKKLCCAFVPGSPMTISPVTKSSGRPSIVTDLPCDSISSCWTWAAKRARASEYGTTARAPNPRKFTFQMPSSAMTTGTFVSRGSSKKCASMARAPSRKARAAVDPRASASGSTPADDVDE